MDTISSLVCWPSLLSVSWGFPLGANDDIDSRKFDAARANTKHALGMVTETYLLVVFVTSAQVHARACGLGTVMTSRKFRPAPDRATGRALQALAGAALPRSGAGGPVASIRARGQSSPVS